MITVSSLHKVFGGRVVLDDVSATFARGQVACLVGPSGGGKSTLLRCLVGLEQPDRGAVRWGEEAVAVGQGADAGALARLRRRVGFVFQQWHLFGHRTVLDNVVEAPVHVLGEARAEARERARPLLERVGLAHRLDAHPAQLSGGEQQRAAIARALAMRPELLLLDEPTSALDPERVGDVVTLLRDLVVADGLGLVIVTHEMRLVRAVADRLVVLQEGRIVEDGPTARVIETPRDERTRKFLGAVL